MKKYKVGDTVHVVEQGNLVRRNNAINHYDANVIKVGRKYFYLNVGYHYGDGVPFNIDDGSQKSNYSSYRIVDSEQSYLEEKESEQILSKLRGLFSGYGAPKYSLSKLKEVAAILEIDV